MRRSTYAAALLVSAATALAGCAALSGLDGITEQACAPDCGEGGATDGTVTGPGVDGPSTGLDGTTSKDTTTPTDTTSPPDDVGTTDDAGQDGEPAPDAANPDDGGDGSIDGTAPDSGEDAGQPDAGKDSESEDAGADTGCGPLTAVTNCSACGDKCTTTNATAPSCSGATCSYTCDSTYLDCNKAITPDLDGCECKAAPGATQSACCGTGCPIAHDYNEDITGSTFYDCVAAGTYNETLAMDACIAFTGNASQCHSGYFCAQLPDGGGSDQGDQVCSDGASTCDCWSYDLTLVGLVSLGDGTKGNCYCPQTGSGATHWD
jgi:hypothetical protein